MNGDTGTWSYQIIAPFGDTTGVTQWLGDSTGAMWACDDAHAVAVDNNGLVHASVGQIVVNVDSITGQTTGSWFPFSDNGLYYWNETMTLPLIVGGLVDLPDFNTGAPADGIPGSGIGNKTLHLFQGGIASPQISIDQNNNPYIVYSALVEWTTDLGDTSGASFKDLYLVYSPDGGNTWNKPVNIAGEIAGVIDGSSGTAFEDDTYPMTHRMIWADNSLNIVWQVDGFPGTPFKDPSLPMGPVDTNLQSIMHFSFNVSTQLPAFVRGVPNAVMVDTSTCGMANGSIDVGSLFNSLGVLGMHYGQLWYSIDGGATYQSSSFFDSLSAGIYSIIVKDATNDSIMISVALSDSGAPAISMSSTAETAPGDSNGTATVFIDSLGTSPYTITWSTGETTIVTLIGDSMKILDLAAGTYTVTVTDAVGCITSGVVEVAGATGINQLTEGSSIKLYPNPTNGTLNIDLVNVKATNIMVYNLLGKAVAKVNGVKSQLNANYTIDLSTLANGTYIVKIQSVDKVITRRVFLNR
ncbi:MAG: T9SS type A sorting domain-containing protein [Bacteroidetes bacterium]|nr:T9SS type A sorting domain-containing protein [Bacteroidota bacterium]